MLAVPGCTGWADHHFLDDFLAFPTRIIRVVLLAFAFVVQANKTCWPWNDTGTSCCAAPGQGAGKESWAARRTDTIDSETWKRADGLTFGVAHVPTGLYAPLWG